MTTLSKLIIAAILGVALTSCKFDLSFGQVTGNGDVVEATRDIDEDFDEIRVSRGLDVYLTQGDETNILIEADENLHDLITTEVSNNILKITSEENIGSASAKKIYVTFENISIIKATSGSDVYSENTIKSDELTLITTSGSDMEVKVNVEDLTLESTSGSDLRVSGTTNLLAAKCSSGADIKAGKLEALEAKVSASSGSDVTVNTSKKLIAKASSGGDIKYYGNPEKVETSDGVSGSVRKKN